MSPRSQRPTLSATAVALGVSLGMLSLATSASAEGSGFLHAPPPPPPSAAPAGTAPARPTLRLRATTPPFQLELRRHEPQPGADGAAARLPATRSDRMKRAFAAELQEEAIKSRRAALYATIPPELPELLEDDYIRKQQARVAESVLGDAIEAAVSEGFFEGRHHEQKLSFRPMFAVADHGLRVDASPSWTYRVRAPRGGFRVDVPLTPSAMRVHVFRDLKGTDKTPMRLGAGVLLDPFDAEIRAGVSLQF